ncbi:hypothetical protein BT96DRAFT_382578 [Gymnopus androsaceus JB14]|uniref:Uncharacterized protein n=1 Tax=Gymnopus androsaceus JB14 TaxID=1447944 RepID=A0A6A4IM07_9AGAR|nr:hypothetical protein BT96DRAFT_382578 [Gymnopus androsaceus JB14]
MLRILGFRSVPLHGELSQSQRLGRSVISKQRRRSRRFIKIYNLDSCNDDEAIGQFLHQSQTRDDDLDDKRENLENLSTEDPARNSVMKSYPTRFRSMLAFTENFYPLKPSDIL